MPVTVVDSASAERIWTELVADNPRDPRGWRGLAGILADTDRPSEALLALRQAEQLAPESVEVQRELGLLLLRLGRPEDASEAFERALATDPQDGPTIYNLGVALLQARQYVQAVDALTLACEANVEAPGCWTNLGLALARVGRYPDAALVFERAAREEPDDLAGQENALGAWLKTLTQLNEAECVGLPN